MAIINFRSFFEFSGFLSLIRIGKKLRNFAYFKIEKFSLMRLCKFLTLTENINMNEEKSIYVQGVHRNMTVVKKF